MEDQAEELREMMKKKGGSTSAPQGGSLQREIKKTRIITVASGKGGVGKTNISVNMAISYARMGKKVVVMDVDLGLSNVNIMLNAIPKYNLLHVIRKQKKMKEILVETPYGISFIGGASGFSEIANMMAEERQGFIEEMQTLASFDIIILDTGAGVSDNVIDFTVPADDVVIVTNKEPTAITDAYGIIKIIATKIDNAEMGINLIVNRVANAGEANKVADKLIKVVQQFLNVKLEYLGFVYEDESVVQAVLRQKPFSVETPRCKASQCIQHIVGRLEKTEIRGAGFGGMLKRIFSGD
ncbi:MAG: MinD/ParA family protein [Spirochaetaceae bacterium]|jgi:flagellar biosynthesis protein FlhG|nr:MinD/ParA family protein [Spirochaetaceae bacterium]